MVHNYWLRPKTSSGLSTADNDSSTILPASENPTSSLIFSRQHHDNAVPHSLSSRRSAHEFFPRNRPSSGYSSYHSLATTENSTSSSAPIFAREGFSRSRFKLGIEEARGAISAIARKAMTSGRDSRPTERLSTHDSTLSTVTSSSSSGSSASIAAGDHGYSLRSNVRPEDPSTAQMSVGRVSRLKHLRDKALRTSWQVRAHRLARDGDMQEALQAQQHADYYSIQVQQFDSNDTSPLADQPTARPRPQDLPPMRTSIHPLHSFAGSAARAAAAEHNSHKAHAEGLEEESSEMRMSHQSMDGMRIAKRRRSGKGKSLPIAENGEPLWQNEDSMDSENGVDEFTDRRRSKPPARTDLIGKLPNELAAAVLSYLDDYGLTRCLRVSKRWHAIAMSAPVWRESFLGRYARADDNYMPYIQFGGSGLGQRPNIPQEWKKMCEVRRRIEKNWKTMSPRAIYFVGHTDSVYCCQFDEDKIITGSRDRTIRVWDLNEPYQCRKVIGGPAAQPVRPTQESVLETHPTHTVLQTPNLNGTPEGNALYHIPSDYHTASILCLQFDKEIMVTGSSDHTCIVWDISTYEPIQRLVHHTAGVLDVCMDDQYIISCSKDAHICVWNRKDYSLIRALHGHRGPVNAVQLREIDGRKLLVSASGDGLAKIWDLQKLEVVKQFNSQDRGLAAVEFSDDGRYVLAGGNDQVIYKFDVATCELVHTFRGHSSLVRSLFLDSANGRVVSGSYDQGIRVFDFNTGELIGSYDNWTTSWILAAKGDYRRIVATSQDGRALLMDFGYKAKNVEMLGGLPSMAMDIDEDPFW